MKFGAEMASGWEEVGVVYNANKVYHVYKNGEKMAVYYEAKTRNGSLCLRYLPAGRRNAEICAFALGGA